MGTWHVQTCVLFDCYKHVGRGSRFSRGSKTPTKLCLWTFKMDLKCQRYSPLPRVAVKSTNNCREQQISLRWNWKQTRGVFFIKSLPLFIISITPPSPWRPGSEERLCPCIHTGGRDFIWDRGSGPSDCYREVMKPICLRCPSDCMPPSHQRAGSEAMRSPLIAFAKMIVSEGRGTGNHIHPPSHTHTLICCWLNFRQATCLGLFQSTCLIYIYVCVCVCTTGLVCKHT